eukprot:5021439-Alexandrium_andersonii.AAC.1
MYVSPTAPSKLLATTLGACGMGLHSKEVRLLKSLRLYGSGTMDPLSRNYFLAPREGYSYGRRAVRSQKMRNCLRRSKLELRGPKNGIKIDPRSSRG